MPVYCIQAGPGGAIKIGHSTNLQARLNVIASANPMPITVLAVIEGGRAVERLVHERFKHLRRRLEWFEPSPELLAFCANPIVPPDEGTSAEVAAGSDTSGGAYSWLIDDLVKAFGSSTQAEFGALLGVRSRSVVNNWKRDGLPAKWSWLIERKFAPKHGVALPDSFRRYLDEAA